MLEFRDLLECHHLTASIFNTIAHHLATKNLLLREDTIIDATLIAAPPLTKKKTGKRDPDNFFPCLPSLICCSPAVGYWALTAKLRLEG